MSEQSIVVEPDLLEARPSDGRRKVAIVGWAGTSRDLAPWEDRTWEKWALNTMAQHAQYSRCDRLYQLHTVETTRADITEDPAFWNWCVTNETVPMYMHFPQPEFPRAVQYPTDEIKKNFRGYFTNSVSWMIAHAIHEGVDVLGVWGVDMANAAGGEYAAQRPSCEYFLGLAEGRGIEIVLPPESDLCRTQGLYGLDDDSNLYKALGVRVTEMQARMNECMAAQNQNAMTISKLQGGIEVASYFQTAWCQPQSKPDS